MNVCLDETLHFGFTASHDEISVRCVSYTSRPIPFPLVQKKFSFIIALIVKHHTVSLVAFSPQAVLKSWFASLRVRRQVAFSALPHAVFTVNAPGCQEGLPPEYKWYELASELAVTKAKDVKMCTVTVTHSDTKWSRRKMYYVQL